MKKTLFSALLLSAALHLSAQTTIFEETFESSVDGRFPPGWETVDRSGSYFTWRVDDEDDFANSIGFSGKKANMMIFSQSSDELLVSPAINLPAGSSFSLSFLIGTMQGSGTIRPQDVHYAVYVLPETQLFTGTEPVMLEEDITEGNVVHPKTIDLSEYAGQSVRIYFRQFNFSSGRLGLLFLDTIQLTQLDQLGTSEVKQENTVGIYPNPTSDYVYLKSKSKITNAEVYDMAGRKMNIKAENEKLDVRDLQPGTYIITTESENKKSSHKLIKK